MFVIEFEQVNAPQESVQCHQNTTLKCSKSTTKTLGKRVKYVQGEIMQLKMSGGIPWGKFSGEGGRGVIVQRGIVLG